jgi:hypothetical protein
VISVRSCSTAVAATSASGVRIPWRRRRRPARSAIARSITYTFTLASGQTLGAGSGRLFATQSTGGGTAHPTSGDTYSVTATSGGATTTQSGHF